MTNKVVVGFDKDYNLEADIVELCKSSDELNLLWYMEEGYNRNMIVNYVNDQVFTDFLDAGKFKWHCTHMDPHTPKEFMHYEFPGYMVLTGIQPIQYHKKIDKLYCCQQQSLGYHRDLLLDCLHDADLLQYGHVSYKQAQVGDEDDILYNKYLQDVKNKPLHRNWQGNIPQWFEYGEHDSQLVYDYFDNPPPPLDIWNRCTFNIITESYFDVPIVDTRLLSEKTYSCLFQAQPFILVGCQHQHRYLQEGGYLLYDEVFDYNFDALPTIEQRIKSIVDQVKNLNNSVALQKSLEKTAMKNQQIIWHKIKNMKLPEILFSTEHVFLPWAQKHRDDILYAKLFVDKYV